MKLYKLTNYFQETRGKMLWGEGVTHTARGRGPLCSTAWIHAYTDPTVAVLMAPIYGYVDGILWEAEGKVGIDDGTKVGCTRLTTIKRMKMPRIGKERRVCFALRCALEVSNNKKFRTWARKWLDGRDRSIASALKFSGNEFEANVVCATVAFSRNYRSTNRIVAETLRVLNLTTRSFYGTIKV